MNVDEGWRPTAGLLDKYGNEIEDRIYNLKDYDKSLVIDERTQIVAKKITEYLKAVDRYAKTIVFCTDIDHANRMRQALINENADMVAKHWNYCVKITGDDEVGKQELDNFTDVEERFPVIATTSKMLTTGIDTKMVKFIVLESNIASMTEFKQIVGRGTRIREADGKVFFTLMDFRKATNLFADPDFDGDPVQIYEPAEDDSVVPPENEDETSDVIAENMDDAGEFISTRPNIDIDEEEKEVRKFYVNNIPVSVANERVQYYGKNGKLITESLKDYTKSNITKAFHSITDFTQKWQNTESKEELLRELAEHGVLIEALKEEIGQDMDPPFDLICHVAYDRPPLTRKERANNVRKRDYFTKYGDTAQRVLLTLLDKYEQEGILSIEKGSVLHVQPLNTMGSPVELVRAFGKNKDFEKALQELENEIYKEGA